MEGYWWQLIRGKDPQISKWGGHGHMGHVTPRDVSPEQCASILRKSYCTAMPSAWNTAQLYQVKPQVIMSNATDLTAEFLLTRGPYAWIGYGWEGCTHGDQERPRPA